MYDRMVREHGYSIRKLAEKLGKDKGYLENRLRLADAPEEIRELVSVRKDTLSHAYELLKVTDDEEAPAAGRAGRERRAVARQAARADRGPAGPRPAGRGGRHDEPTDAGPTPTAIGDDRRRRGRPGPARRRTRDGQPAATTRSSRPATSWPRPSRSWSASCGRRTSSARSRTSIGRTSRST